MEHIPFEGNKNNPLWIAQEIYRMDTILRRDIELYSTTQDLYEKEGMERNITNTRKYVRDLYARIGIRWDGDLL